MRSLALIRHAAVTLLLVLALAPLASAQFKAGLQGTVADTSGGVIASATVTLKNEETQQTLTTQTSAEGFYRFSALAPGRYTLTAEAQGFKKLTREHVSVRAEMLEGQNVELEPGVVTESVTVSAASETPLKTEEASISRTMSREEVEKLPQINRDPYELIRLAPGVFGSGARSGSGNSVGLPNTTGPGGSNVSIFQTENQVPVSANGQRLSNNNFEVDGVSVNSLGWGGAAVLTPNQESVKEMTVRTNPYSSEYGRNSGVQVEVVSQNGSNDWHGSAFFKYNDPNLNAFNKYGGPNGAPPVRVENKFRQYGGSAGGRIIRDKLFFFFSYEGLKNRTNTPYTAWIETPQFRQAVIAARPNSVTANILQSPGIEPRVIAALPATCAFANFPAANCQEVQGGLDIGSLTGAAGQYVNPDKQPTGGGLDAIPDIQFAQLGNPSDVTGNQYNSRFDYLLGSNDTFAYSLYVTPRSGFSADPGGRSRPMADVTDKPLSQAHTLTYTRILSPTMINQARFNLTRFADDQVAASTTNWGIPRIEIEALPFDRIRFGANRAETTPALLAQNTWEVNDVVSKVHGTHALKFGALYRKEDDNNNLLGGARPLYSFTGLFNFANGTPIFEAVNASPTTGASASAQRYFRTHDVGVFVQDDWKARPNLTLNLGLRYEFFSPTTEARGESSNIFFGSEGLKNAVIKPVDSMSDADWNNFGPRVGFAYSPSRMNQKLAVRGGFGVFYNRIPGVMYSNTRGNPPFFARYNICCGTAADWFSTPFAGGLISYVLGTSTSPSSYPPNAALATGINPETGAPNGGAVEIYGVQHSFPNSYVYEWSLDTEYQLPGNMVASLGYQASAGHKLIRIVNQNFLYPNNGAFYAVYIPQPDVNSNFNGLLAGLRKQYSRGIAFGVNYRWSKSIDTLSYEGPGAVTNQTYPQDLSTERGPSDFDVTHYFNASAVFEIPSYRGSSRLGRALLSGFLIDPIITAHSGFPWTAKIGTCVSTPGGPSLCPSRPTRYFGGAPHVTSNDAFVTPGAAFPGGGAKFFDITSSGPPGIGRNNFRGPHYFSTDFSIIKNTRLPLPGTAGEAANLELRINLYNAFNQRNLAPFNFFDASTFADNPNFGVAQAGLAGRVVELQARFSF